MAKESQSKTRFLIFVQVGLFPAYMQLKKFEGIAMHKISSLLPFVNFSKQIQEIRTDGYPTDSKNLSELSKLQSLKTLFLNVSFKDKELKNTVKYLNSLCKNLKAPLEVHHSYVRNILVSPELDV